MNRIHYRRLLPAMDSRPLLSLYRRSIAALGDDLYSTEQRTAWAQWANDAARADGELRQGLTVVALANGSEVGFAQLHPGHMVNMLYVDDGWQRQGIGKGLVLRLETIARRAGIATLSTRASGASYSLFQRLGFEPGHREWARADNGTALKRTRMHKPLVPYGPAPAALSSVDDDGSTDGPAITRKGHVFSPSDR